MASTVVGTGTIYGLDNATIAIVAPSSPAIAAANMELTAIAFSSTQVVSTLSGKDGQHVAAGSTGREDKLTTNFFFRDTTRSAAASIAAVFIPATILTVAGTGVGTAGSSSGIDGTWNFDGEFTMNLSNNGFGTCSARWARRGQTPTAAMAVVT